jgi:hypothetical protein
VSTDLEEWLRHLAAKGGAGGVDNVDARALGRAADEMGRLRRRVDELLDANNREVERRRAAERAAAAARDRLISAIVSP